ncbi:MAG: hypothetical protein QM749_14050 [Aquabacterium sp.]
MLATNHQKPVLTYQAADLLADHVYAQPHTVHGLRLHGGLDTDGRYVSPRSLHRPAAIRAWTQALIDRGGQPLAPDPRLMAGPNMPNADQWRFLLREGFWQPLWRLLTHTAMAEGRGRVMAAWPVPDLQEVIHEDIAGMALGHWHRGLLQAHGLDEGGDAMAKVGGHEAMWRLVRDLAFGELPPDARPAMTPLKRIVPADGQDRLLPEAHYKLIAMVMNLFLVECRADAAFTYQLKLFSSPELFPGRAQALQTALTLIQRIEQDEQIHLESMSLYLGEMRELTFKCTDGTALPGRELLDRMWGRMVRWTLAHQKRIEYLERRAEMHAMLRAAPDGERLVAEFDALADSHPWQDGEDGEVDGH